MFDLLGGALAGDSGRVLWRLPLSFQRAAARGAGRRWRPLTPAERAQGRDILAGVQVTPGGLARRRRPVTFVDVVDGGNAFTDLFELLRNWIDEQREPWPVIRRKVRFVGVTVRRKTSPNTYRRRHEAAWTRQLPARAVVNVSLDGAVWSYFGDHQTKFSLVFADLIVDVVREGIHRSSCLTRGRSSKFPRRESGSRGRDEARRSSAEHARVTRPRRHAAYAWHGRGGRVVMPMSGHASAADRTNGPGEIGRRTFLAIAVDRCAFSRSRG